MKYFFKLSLIKLLLASMLSVMLSACTNPLSGGLAQTTFDETHQPGLGNLNVSPIAANSSLTVLMNIVKSGTLSASDANAGDTLTYSVVAQGTLGVVAITDPATGAFTYTPNNNVIGSDSFTFKVNDGTVDSNTATVTVTIYDPNIAPVASAISPAAFNEDTQSGVITLSYTDADGDLATACTISNLSGVTVTQACACNGAGVCTLKVTGTANTNGAASFNYKVTANGQDSNVVATTLSINAVNDTPTISAILAQSTNEDAAKAVTFTISDVETTITCAAAVSMTSTDTTLVPNTNVVWSGTAPNCTGTVNPAANLYGSSDLTFTVTDGALTAISTFTLTVTRLGDDAFTSSWPFDFLSDALYTFTNTVIRLTGGVAELIATVQTDSSATETTDGTFTAGTKSGVIVGTLADGATTGLKLGNSGGCNGGSSDCAKQSASEIYELSSSWTPQWASLKSYWKMNNSWNDSKGSVNGTAQNGVTFTSSAQIGSHAGSFDGSNDYVSIPSFDTGITTRLSVAFWVKNNVAAESGKQIVMDPTALVFSTFIQSQKIHLYLNNNSGWHFAVSSPVYSDWNNWNHFILTYDGSYSRIYKNGALVATSALESGGPATSTAAFGVGGTASANYWNGNIDELALWNTDLNANEVQTIYERQKSAYSGTFTSRIMDAKSSSSWTTLSWIPTLPFFKELPDSTCSPTPCTHNAPENSSSTTGYSSLVGSTGATSDATISTSGLIGLWHLDESSWGDVANEVKDDSGLGNHGRAKNGAVTTSNGKLGYSGQFDGTNDYVTVGDITATTGTTSLTVANWVRWGGTVSGNTSAATFLRSNNVFAFGSGWSTGKPRIWFINGGWVHSGDATTRVDDGNWHHVVGVYDGTYARIYVDGVQENSNNIGSTTFNSGGQTVFIGCAHGSSEYWNGQLDEVAIWSRALNANEIKQLYQRGASRIKYQIRSCYDAACLYKDSINTAANWQGPDGTSGSYFSELNNNTTPLTGAGDVKATLPSMLFSNFTAAPSANQYFQYRTIFESDSSTVALMPELKSTTVDPIHYPAYATSNTSPGNTIIGVSGVAFFDLNAYTETLGAGGCSSGVVYNIGATNAGPWKYWTGATWATADGSAGQANTAAAVNTNIAAYGTQFGTGSVFFKAFLKSDGTSKCELSNIQVGGNR